MRTYHDIFMEQLNEKLRRMRDGEEIILDHDEREYLAWQNEHLNGKAVDFTNLMKWNRIKELSEALCEHNNRYKIAPIDPIRNARNATLGFNTGTKTYVPNDSEMPIITEMIALADNIIISCTEESINIGLTVRDIWSE
ncbi:MAG: hypothetical protein AB7D36_11125 [Oscillospiraceae bacterium]